MEFTCATVTEAPQLDASGYSDSLPTQMYNMEILLLQKGTSFIGHGSYSCTIDGDCLVSYSVLTYV